MSQKYSIKTFVIVTILGIIMAVIGFSAGSIYAGLKSQKSFTDSEISDLKDEIIVLENVISELVDQTSAFKRTIDGILDIAGESGISDVTEDVAEENGTSFQIINGGFEEDTLRDPWKIPGWENQGTTGAGVMGYSGKSIELHMLGTYSTSLSQSVYFPVKEGTLSFWIKPFPRGLNVSIQVLIDGIVEFNERYYGSDDDFSWINVVIDFDTRIRTQEIKFIIPADWDAGTVFGEGPSVRIDEVILTP